MTGLLFYGKKVKGKSFITFIKHKIFTILVPQITCSVLYFLFSILVYVVIAKTHRVVDFITFDLFMWFLVVLFLMEVVMFLGLRITDNIKIQIVYMILSLVLFFATPEFHKLLGDLFSKELSDYLRRTAEQLFGALFFGWIGMLTRPLIEKYRNCTKLHGVGLFGYCLVVLFAQFNEPIGMYVNDYGNRFVFIAVAILGIMSAVDISFLLEKSSMFSYLDKNSIIIYVTHFRILDVIFIGVYKLFSINIRLFPGFLIVFPLLMLIEIPVIWFANKYVPFLFGKRKIKRLDTSNCLL